MRCPRCGVNNPPQTWYCRNCGSRLFDYGTEEQGPAAPRPGYPRWLIGIAIASTVAVVLITLGTVVFLAYQTFARPSARVATIPTAVVGGIAATSTPVPPASATPTTPAIAVAQPTRPQPAQATNTPVPRPATPTPQPPPTVASPATQVPIVIGRIRPNGEPARAPRTKAPPRIDGDVSEWPGSGYALTAVVYGGESWGGPKDLSGTYWADWDDRNLYLAVRVVDDIFVQTQQGTNLFRGDSVEIQWDTNLEADFDNPTWNADDFHIGLSPGNFANLPPEAVLWWPVQRPAGEIRVAARRTGDGYSLEAAIPWSLVGVKPTPGLAFGWALSLSDDDAPGQAVQQKMVSSSPVREWHKPASLGTLILEP